MAVNSRLPFVTLESFCTQQLMHIHSNIKDLHMQIILQMDMSTKNTGKGTCRVMIIIVGNEDGDQSSNAR